MSPIVISYCLNYFFPVNAEVAQPYHKSAPSEITLLPTATIFNVPVVDIEPQKPYSDDIVTITVKASVDPDMYSIVVGLPDQKGRFTKYSPYSYDDDYHMKTEYNSKNWVAFSSFSKSTKFRIEVYPIYEDEAIYISDLYAIDIQSSNEKLYSEDYIGEESIAMYNEHTKLRLSINTIYGSFSTAVITFPDGTTWSGFLEPGESKQYKYQGNNYSVSLTGLDRDTKKYYVNISEIE